MNDLNLSLSKLAVLSLATVSLAACEKSGNKAAEAEKPAQPEVHAATAAPEKNPTVTLLITSDEHGFIETRDGAGAAELLGKWKAEEGHCIEGDAGCERLKTLVLSTGDHWGGPAISSFYLGEPVAEVLKLMGYAASGFGNHELDFGKEQFQKNADKGGFPYVAANLTGKAGGPTELGLKPFVVLERQGVKIAVIGLTDTRTTRTAMAGRFAGLEVKSYADALATAVPEAWKAGADAVVVLADECPSEIEKAIEGKAEEYKLAVIAGGHCPGDFEKKVGGTTLASPGRRFEKYLRARLSFDTSRPAGQRLVSTEAAVVSGKGAKPDPKLAEAIGNIRARLDRALGEEIGFTQAGLAEGSPELARWVAGAIRENLKTDVALINKGGLRSGVPAGKITKASVYSVMPFENSLLKLRLTGAQLKAALAKPEALYSGAVKSGETFKVGGKALGDKRQYSVATVEYLYFGGDGFEFEKQDENPIESGQMWQTPVIEWTRSQATDEKRPLEKALPKT